MSISKSTALTNAQANNDTLTAAANARFIAATDQQITDAIAQGFFYVTAWTTDNINTLTVAQYYLNLGYGVSLPDYPQNLILQPAELFGEFWINFWTNGFIPSVMTKPYRFTISWKP